MGGSVTIGNVTPAAEFHVWYNPEAADVVFCGGVLIWMCGLNLTHQARIDEDAIERAERAGTQASRVASGFLRFLLRRVRTTFGVAHAALHDPSKAA